MAKVNKFFEAPGSPGILSLAHHSTKNSFTANGLLDLLIFKMVQGEIKQRGGFTISGPPYHFSLLLIPKQTPVGIRIFTLPNEIHHWSLLMLKNLPRMPLSPAQQPNMLGHGPIGGYFSHQSESLPVTPSSTIYPASNITPCLVHLLMQSETRDSNPPKLDLC